uniref:ArfGAP with GTPase domain, ankyrin repeat and PH domain 3 n=1 Tax=Knipowitschia caucasica TaxID=637954 RepID=A0AAV2JUR0_KNICA
MNEPATITRACFSEYSVRQGASTSHTVSQVCPCCGAERGVWFVGGKKGGFGGGVFDVGVTGWEIEGWCCDGKALVRRQVRATALRRDLKVFLYHFKTHSNVLVGEAQILGRKGVFVLIAVVTEFDSFVNSQEWTLSRSVPELKVGIVGNLSSGKSALVHRYLTGTYVQEESPEGGRFKKEIVVDGQSYLLLIRDEGGPPELQFAAWVDAVVFVFSLEDEISFQTVYNYFLRLSSYRNTAEVPMVLVGTQDAISAANPRVIDDSRARKLSNDLKRCTYYETCSTYGLNVERVFQDVSQKVVAMRKKQQLSIGPCKSLPNSPSHSSVPAASLPSVHMNQAANGGGAFSDYSSSVPSTPSISQREMRIETIAASNTPTPIRKQSKRRSNIFTILSLQ